MPKRKAEADDRGANAGQNKRPANEANGVSQHFGETLFAPETLTRYTKEYAESTPYKHAIVSGLMNEALLRSVRSEIVDNIHFTPKETDIYKIHQSGDLANLDGLPASALEKLPSLLQLRDALYSQEFRHWLSHVTGAGPLSGTKTDMAVNLYVPGCHLLCHDDVIGSRRVSYILYLTDPDTPWKAEWGGALRLYPTDSIVSEEGNSLKFPRSEWIKSIPPAWNQLSFFAVQPGESFHDVEEVYRRTGRDEENQGGRFRMAISGWFHIPQEDEEGFEPGLEERLAEKSSLQQLQGKSDEFERPRTQWMEPQQTLMMPQSQPGNVNDDDDADDDDVEELTRTDLEFLLKFMTPNYLTPDTVEELSEMFADESMLQLSNFLNPKFSDRLRAWIENGKVDERAAQYSISLPPHKHRYQYAHPTATTQNPDEALEDPFSAVLSILLPSLAFKKWLSLATGLSLKRTSVLARCFRRGLDYQLAQGYEGDDPQLEYCLCVTPTRGWGGDSGEDEIMNEQNGESTASAANGKGKAKQVDNEDEKDEEDNFGGYELYMAEDDGDEEDDAEPGNDTGIAKTQSNTGAGDRRQRGSKKSSKADPAVYKEAKEDEEDDGILVSNPASWNTLSVALRDRGTLKFVKYVSQSAPGNRYDFAGCVGVDPDGDEDVEAGE